MKRLIAILALLAAVASVNAVDRITLVVTVTGVPISGNSLTVNSDIRTWGDVNNSATILTNLVGVNESTTNLFNQIASYPYSGGTILQYVSANAIRLVGSLGANLSASQFGSWASLTLSTQSGPSTFTAVYPLENIVGATNRTNEASALVYGLSLFSTQAFATNSASVSNLLQKGAGPLQIVSGPVHLIGAVQIGSLSTLTNGYWTNATLDKPQMTNGTNRGLAFASPGIYPNSHQFAGGSVGGGNSLALGGSAQTNAVSVGYLASAGVNGIAIGFGADGSPATNAIVIGQNGTLGNASNAVALGNNIIIGNNHHNSMVIGYGGSSTTNNQVVLGGSSHTVYVPGLLSAASQTNSTFRGTNVINGRVDFTSRANTGLANGNNAGVVLGTNVYVRLSGATTIGALAGFAAEQDGSFHILQFTGAITNLFLNESGVDATAANRIITGTGADLALTNSPTVIAVCYDATASRWRLVSFFR